MLRPVEQTAVVYLLARERRIDLRQHGARFSGGTLEVYFSSDGTSLDQGEQI
jgi:hypothetical protein